MRPLHLQRTFGIIAALLPRVLVLEMSLWRLTPGPNLSDLDAGANAVMGQGDYGSSPLPHAALADCTKRAVTSQCSPWVGWGPLEKLNCPFRKTIKCIESI